MDLIVIDEVSADSLEAGDTILFYDEDGTCLGHGTIKRIEDDGEGYTLVSEDDDEMLTDYDSIFYLYGYAVVEV